MTSNATTEAPAENPWINLFDRLNGHPVTLLDLIVCSINIVVSALMLTLNGLVLDTMLRQGKAQEPADFLVASLAAVDTLLGVYVLWVTVYYVTNFQSVWECLARLGLAHSMMITGMLHLLGLTVDRYLKIAKPFRYHDICQKWAVSVFLAAIWLLGVTLGSLPTLGWNTRHIPDESECTYFGVMDPNFLRVFMCIMFGITISICVMYAMMYRVARKHARAISDILGSLSGGRSRSSERKFFVNEHTIRYTKTVLLLIGVNFLCFMPSCATLSFSITGLLDHMSNTRKGDLMLYTSIFVYLNSLINPLIYAVKIPVIRRRYLTFIRKWPCYYACRKTGLVSRVSKMSVGSAVSGQRSAVPRATSVGLTSTGSSGIPIVGVGPQSVVPRRTSVGFTSTGSSGIPTVGVGPQSAVPQRTSVGFTSTGSSGIPTVGVGPQSAVPQRTSVGFTSTGSSGIPTVGVGPQSAVPQRTSVGFTSTGSSGIHIVGVKPQSAVTQKEGAGVTSTGSSDVPI